MTVIVKPVERLTRAIVRDAGFSRPLVVTLAGDGIFLRQQGRQLTFYLPYEAAYSCAAKMAAEATRREKVARRSR